MSEPDADTAPLPAVAPPARRRRRRLPIVLLVLAVLVVVLAIVAVVAVPKADSDFRAQAERQIETSVQNSLPTGVQGFATATIHGSSALLQYRAGHFDDVTITFADLHVNGRPASLRAEVHDLPVNGGRIGSAVVVLTVDGATVRSLAPLAGTGATAPTLRTGTIATTVTQKVLGLAVLVDLTLKAALAHDAVTLRPATATIRSGPFHIPATAIVQALYPNGITVCAAKYLPQGVALTGLRIRPNALTLTLTARDVTLAALQSGAKGHC